MMRTVVNTINAGALLLKLADHSIVNQAKVLLGVYPARNTRLIRHDDRLEMRFVNEPNSFRNPGIYDQVPGA
jgi:hypothetical protein